MMVTLMLEGGDGIRAEDGEEEETL